MKAATNVGEFVVAGRRIYVCDGFIGDEMINDVATKLRGLHYERAETSREGAPPSGSSAEIPITLVERDSFFEILRATRERFFPGRHQVRRVYVNLSVYGDMYYPHRDCPANATDVTVLYYVNSQWSRDWGGETVFFNEQGDAEVVVSPRPGRIVVFLGAILHRGGVPSRICYEERLTLAYKTSSAG